MKKLFVVSVMACFVFACSRKTAPAAEEIIISNKKEEKNLEKTVAPGDKETNAGKTVYTTRCGSCHTLKPVDKYTAAQWENILKSMIPKAKLSEHEATDVSDYIMKHAKK